MADRSGFTLLEVLVALAIVATAWTGVAVALPRLLAPPPTERAAADVEALLRRTGTVAAAGRVPLAVRLSPDGRAVIAPAMGLRVELPASVSVRLEGVAGLRAGTGRASAEAAGTAAIVFLPDGSSSGGRVILAETEDGGHASPSDGVAPPAAVLVHISWLTGRVERR